MAHKASLTRTLSIGSGKGGVGKTTVTANLAHTLSERGHRILILDGDLGMANIEIFFGAKPKGYLNEVLSGEKEMAQIITNIAPRIDLISGGSGITDFNRITPFERRAMVDAISMFEFQYDYLLIDTAPGISENVLYLNAAAQESLIVLTPDASSLTDSYALIKVLNQQFRENRFSILCNQVRDEAEGLALFQKFTDVAQRFLNVSLDYWGSLPNDVVFRKAAAQQKIALKNEQSVDVRRTFDHMADQIETAMSRHSAKAGLQFFWEQVVGVA